MAIQFSVWIMVSLPPAQVYEAVADPDLLSRYFTTGGAKGRAEAGATVTWDFADFPGAFPVSVVEAIPPERIVFDWGKDEGGQSRTRVTFTFEPLDGGARTKVSVSETGWRDDEAGRAASYGNCMGWSQMIAALKMWLEHGINLREGAYA